MTTPRPLEIVVLRPFRQDNESTAYNPCVTHRYAVGWVTPVYHGRTKKWHASKTEPKLRADGLWADPDTVGPPFATKREALAHLGG